MKELKIVKELLVCCCLVSILWTSCQQRKEARDIMRDVGTLRTLATETDAERCRRYLAVQKTNEAVEALARIIEQEEEEGQQDGTIEGLDINR